MSLLIGFGGLEGSVLAFGTQVRGFKPGRSRRISSGEKILSAPSFGGEVKPSVSCRKFTACKRNQKWRGCRHSRQNSRQFFSHSSTFHYWGSFASSNAGDSLWRELERSNHWSSRLGFWRAAGQRHSVKPFLLRILNDSWEGQNPQGLQCRLKKKKNFTFTYRQSAQPVPPSLTHLVFPKV